MGYDSSRSPRSGRNSLVSALVLLLTAVTAQDPQDPSRVHSEIYKKTAPAVVAVRQTGRWGSGVIIDKSGLLLTSSQVVFPAETVMTSDKGVSVFRAGCKAEQADIIGVVKELELSILRLRGKEDYPYVELGDSGAADVGKVAYVLGDSFSSLSGDGEPAISVGVVSAHLEMPPDAKASNPKARYVGPVLETTAAVNQGQGGAPMLDGKGRLIGLVTMRYIEGRFTGLAIPVNAMKDKIRRVKEGRPLAPRPGPTWIGATLQIKDNALVVARVFAGGPADKAGLTEGDRIVSVKSNDVFTSVGAAVEIRDRLSKLEDGESLTVRVRRGETQREATIVAELKEFE